MISNRTSIDSNLLSYLLLHLGNRRNWPMDEEFVLRLMCLVKELIVALVETIESQSAQQPSVLYVNSKSKDSSIENGQIK